MRGTASSDFGLFWSVLVRDPYLVLGLLILTVPAVASWRIFTTCEGGWV